MSEATAAQQYFDPPDPVPTCDICEEPQSMEWGEENDWNGETGNHETCEEREAEDAAYDPYGARHIVAPDHMGDDV